MPALTPEQARSTFPASPGAADGVFSNRPGSLTGVLVMTAGPTDGVSGVSSTVLDQSTTVQNVLPFDANVGGYLLGRSGSHLRQLPFSLFGRALLTAGTSQTGRELLQLGSLALASPTGTADASTFLRGDNTWQPLSGIVTTDASLLTSGTLDDTRLSANVPLKNAANVFTASQTVGNYRLNVGGLAAAASFHTAVDSGVLVKASSGRSLLEVHAPDDTARIALQQISGNFGGYLTTTNYALTIGASKSQIRFGTQFSGAAATNTLFVNPDGANDANAPILAVLNSTSQTADTLQLWGVSSTSTQRVQAAINSGWDDSTDATRTGKLSFGTYYTGTYVEGIRLRSPAGRGEVYLVADQNYGKSVYLDSVAMGYAQFTPGWDGNGYWLLSTTGAAYRWRTDRRFEVFSSNASYVPLTVKGATSQSANLTEWQDSSGTVGARVTAAREFSNTKGYTASESFGDSTILGGIQCLTVGNVARAHQAYSTALGAYTFANGLETTAVGTAAYTAAQYGTAIGAGSRAPAYASTAIGAYADSGGYSNAVALGFFSMPGADGEFRYYSSTYNPSFVFARDSSTTQRPVAGLTASWADPTDATRTGQLSLGAYYIGTLQTGMTITARSGGTAIVDMVGGVLHLGAAGAVRLDGSSIQSLLFNANGSNQKMGFIDGTNLVMATPSLIGWASTSTVVYNSAPDTAIARNAAGVVEVNNGTAGTYRDLILRKVTGETASVPVIRAAAGTGFTGALRVDSFWELQNSGATGTPYIDVRNDGWVRLWKGGQVLGPLDVYGAFNFINIGTVLNAPSVGLLSVSDGGTANDIGVRFQRKSSTTAGQDVAQILASWADSTHATRTGQLSLGAYYTSTLQEGLRIVAGSGGTPAVTAFGTFTVGGLTVSNPINQVLVNASMSMSDAITGYWRVYQGFAVSTAAGYGFTSSASSAGTIDAALWRNAAGVVEVNNGTAGTYRDLRLRNVRTEATTVAGLVAAATAGAGARAFVTDATATTFASAVTGGGANAVPVYSDGAAWYIG